MNYRNTKHVSPSAYLLMLICMICACTCPLHAQESCYEQYLREHNMPFLTAEDADDSYEELKKEVLARQAMRREALFQPLLLAVDTISGTCHLLSQDGSLIADVHLALVDSTWYMWLSVDPLADKYPGSTPYIYCNGNPVMYVDPDGKRPTAYEAALLAACAYENDNNVIEQKLSGTGWVKSSFPTSISMQNENNGLQSALFEKAVDGVTEYVYAFAGTHTWYRSPNQIFTK